MQTMNVWYLCLNGDRVHRGKSRHECMRWLDNIQPHSRKHAMRYDGYSVIKTHEHIVGYRKKGITL